MKTNQTRSKHDSDKSKVNGWKLSFILLVFLIVGFVVYIGFLLQPLSTNQTETPPTVSDGEQVSLTTSLTKEDTELIINEYLNKAMGEEFDAYTIILSDKLEIHGEMTILNFAVPFKLYFSPYALENGDIQLRGEAVELANYSLPVSGVMSLLGRQLALPEFIAIDSNAQIIEIDLAKLMEDYSFDITVDQIDLEQDVIQFNLGIDKDSLTSQFD